MHCTVFDKFFPHDMFESNNMMEPWIFSNENSDLLNSIIEQSQQESKNGIQNHLQTLFRNVSTNFHM